MLFIDASAEGNYEKGKNQNLLRDCDIEKIVQVYRARENVDKYAYDASFDEIKENDFNLNIPRYVDTFEEEELVDIDQVKQNIADIETELAQVQAQMQKYLKSWDCEGVLENAGNYLGCRYCLNFWIIGYSVNNLVAKKE